MTLIPELRSEIVRAARRQSRPRAHLLNRPRFVLAGGSLAVSAAIAVVIVLVFSASPVTSRAYALAPQSQGTYTLTLYSLTNDIPQLNAKLAQMGIDETVVPVTSSCTHQFPIYVAGNDNTTETLYVGRRYLAPGYQGVLAAEALPDGQVALAQGALLPGDIPSCFATMSHTHFQIIPGPSSGTGNTGNSGNTGNTGDTGNTGS